MAPDMRNLEQKVHGILCTVRPECAKQFNTSADYFNDGLLDSFDLITFVSDLDRDFGISIDGTDIIPENFLNLPAIAALLLKTGVTP